MKKIIVFLFLAIAGFTDCIAQREEEEPTSGFKKENLFTGGTVTVSFFNRQTILGANPIFGYKITDWMDAGLAFNYVYTGARDYQQFGDKIRQNVYGPGAFMRVYPVKFIFLQGQFEHNISSLKYIYPGGGLSETIKADANSFLVGAGLAQGRERGSTTFFYISLLFDVIKDINSPYVNVTVNPNNPSEQRVEMSPIIRAGMNIGLFQGRNRRY